MIDGWTPGIGDPTWGGWITVVFYLIAAGVCASNARRPDQDGGRFWAVLALSMLALGINKQLDLQSLFTAVLRDNAVHYGWFGERRELQLAFIVVIGGFGLVLAAALAYYLRALQRSMRVAALGVCLVYTYVIIRAASFHHVDRIIGAAILGGRWSSILEIGGILVVLIGALGVERPSNN
ncbi:hypothetical protein [Sphingomonas phyllosphaerae]|uniref:hypothetical protein n=1 Tax=Sphingomonas phyllosphaerae TaxID=257003 RepID=UPI00048C5DE6|nr:hypothetical protein [Sphingomonas phyllosphaerae]